MTYQTTNYFDVTRQDGTHTAANEELVVSDGGTITPPTPTAGETFGVRALRNDVTLVPNNSFEGSTNDRRIDAEGNAVFVSDGTEWYLVSGEEHFGFDIPDSEGFEHNDLTGVYNGDTGSFSIQRTTVDSGTHALETTAGGSHSVITRQTRSDPWSRTDGLRLTWRQQLGSSSLAGAAIMTKQQGLAKNNGFLFDTRTDNNQILIQKVTDGSLSPQSSTSYTSTTGSYIDCTVDLKSDGSMDFSVEGSAVITHTDTDFTDVYLAWHGIFDTVQMDTVEITSL